MKSFVLKVKFVRRIPDPVFPNADRHILICAVEDVPAGFPKDPNPREQKIDWGIWKDIRRHLLNEDGTRNTFHLKNKGITLLASAVEKVDDHTVKLSFADGDGILDGGHTYKLVVGSLAEIREKNEVSADDPITQFVKVEILTGIDRNLTVELAGGLNTGMQVQRMSLANLTNEFSWIKEELADEPYVHLIAFRENEGLDYDVRDILVLLDLFNVFAFPNTINASHPTRAYSQKAEVLDAYLAHKQQYESLRPILKDILRLHDEIASTGAELYNAAGRAAREDGSGPGAKALKLAFIDKRKKGEYKFVFSGKTGTNRVSTGALFPMMAAFRWLVEVDKKSGRAHWRGGFTNVLRLWENVAAEMMRRTRMTSDSVDRKVNAIGRNAQHWAQLYDFLVRAEMQASAE